MLKIIITVFFIYVLIRLLTKLIFLAFGVFLKRTLKSQYSNAAQKKSYSRKEQNRDNVIDAEFEEIE